MLEKKVSRLVVIDDDNNQNNSVGIISESDLSRTVPAFKSRTVRMVYEHIGLLFSSKSKPNFIIEPSFIRIEDIMTPNAVPIDKDAESCRSSKINDKAPCKWTARYRQCRPTTNWNHLKIRHS